MKKVIVVIFLFIFSLQTFYTASITTWFYANRNYITKEHCVNKNRPELKCNGKCYLSKKLKKAEENEEEQAPKQSKKWVEISPCNISTINYTVNITSKIPVYNPGNAGIYNFIRYKAIFHPPSVIFS